MAASFKSGPPCPLSAKADADADMYCRLVLTRCGVRLPEAPWYGYPLGAGPVADHPTIFYCSAVVWTWRKALPMSPFCNARGRNLAPHFTYRMQHHTRLFWVMAVMEGSP
jgi:hypothetical protein